MGSSNAAVDHLAGEPQPKAAPVRLLYEGRCLERFGIFLKRSNASFDHGLVLLMDFAG